MREPEPSAPSFLAWGPPQPSGTGELPTTYWLAAERGGVRVVGRASGALVFAGGEVWRWSTQEWHQKTTCAVETAGTFADESVFVGGFVEALASGTRVYVVEGSDEPLNCSSILDSRTDLTGSVGPFLFVDSSYHDYGGGAHGINQLRFDVFDLVSGRSWLEWASEITVSASAQKLLVVSLGERPGPRAPQGGSPYVDLRPGSVTPWWEPSGALSLRLCFELDDTNVPELTFSLSRGSPRTEPCPPAALPRRLAPYAQAPQAVVEFARDSKVPRGGWSSLPAGVPLPPAARSLFSPVYPDPILGEDPRP